MTAGPGRLRYEGRDGEKRLLSVEDSTQAAEDAAFTL